ncbi:MAG: universal stress protein [Actinomycetota bacterium]
MIDTLIVAVDGSEESWRAIDVAARLAQRAACSVRVVEVVAFDAIVDGIGERLARQCDSHQSVQDARAAGVEIDTTVVQHHDPVAGLLRQIDRSNAMVVMSSRGLGRTAAVIGSVTSTVVAEARVPVICVGPEVDVSITEWNGPVIATVDGSDLAERALPIATRLADTVEATAWIVNVSEPDHTPTDVVESAHIAHLARALGPDTQFEVLHGDDVPTAVAAFATNQGAAAIVASTQGRTGLDRLVLGSTAAGFVRRAPCPVVLVNRTAPSLDP